MSVNEDWGMAVGMTNETTPLPSKTPDSAIERAGMSERKLNWRRPVAEFVAIFAGVTLSFVADDWREWRAERRDEIEALGAILTDLEADSSEIEFSTRPPLRYQDASKWLTDHWDDASVDETEVGAYLATFTVANPYRPRKAAYSSLEAANGVGLISDEGLRTAIVDYFDRTQVTMAFVNEYVLTQQRGVVERLARYARTPSPRDPDQPWPLEGPWRFVTPWREVASDIQLANQVQELGVVGYFAQRERQNALEANSELRAAIGRVLARSTGG